MTSIKGKRRTTTSPEQRQAHFLQRRGLFRRGLHRESPCMQVCMPACMHARMQPLYFFFFLAVPSSSGSYFSFQILLNQNQLSVPIHAGWHAIAGEILGRNGRRWPAWAAATAARQTKRTCALRGCACYFLANMKHSKLRFNGTRLHQTGQEKTQGKGKNDLLTMSCQGSCCLPFRPSGSTELM